MNAAPSKPHSRAVEDYIKTIYKLDLAGEKPTTKAIAGKLGLGRGTVSGMLSHLADRGLVERRPYYGVHLTHAGNTLAARMVRRHRLLELFLVRMLGLGWDEVDEDAERLEHAVSDRLIERIDELLGRPDIDPHGAPIPDAEGQIAQQEFAALHTIEPNTTCQVRRVPDGDAKLLQHLAEQGLILNAEVSVVESGPFGVVQLTVGSRNVHLAREIAAQIRVATIQ